MNCYFHDEKAAVGQCEDCAKYLCKACASKYQPYILCDSCADTRIKRNRRMKEFEKEEGLNRAKKRLRIYLICFIVMLLLCVVSQIYVRDYIEMSFGVGLLLILSMIFVSAYGGLVLPTMPSIFWVLYRPLPGTIKITDFSDVWPTMLLTLIVSWIAGPILGIIQIVQCIKVLKGKPIKFTRIWKAWYEH